MRYYGTATIKNPGEINIYDPLPVIVCLLLNRGYLTADAGIVYQNIDVIEYRENLVNHHINRLGIGDIARKGVRVGSS
jgi:hypothetical protein